MTRIPLLMNIMIPLKSIVWLIFRISRQSLMIIMIVKELVQVRVFVVILNVMLIILMCQDVP